MSNWKRQNKAVCRFKSGGEFSIRETVDEPDFDIKVFEDKKILLKSVKLTYEAQLGKFTLQKIKRINRSWQKKRNY
jgi:hypothetical protein